MSNESRSRLVSTLLLTLLMGSPSFAQSTVNSTAQDQKELAVTVYNSNVALVRDVRRLQLPAGTLDLRYMDIAAQVNPATVHIVSLSAPKDLSVLEQNYEYDLLSPQKLLQKYVGKELTVVRLVTENNSTREVPLKATLLALNEGPVWRVGNEIITGMGADRYVFPDLPENLYSKPTLVWLLENTHAGEQTVEASYLTNQVNWNADYVLTVHSDQKAADLNGWVTVVNNSGTAFQNAQLQLVAGEVHRVSEAAPAAPLAKAMTPPGPRPPSLSRSRSPSTTFTRSSAAPTCRTTKPSRSACSMPRESLRQGLRSGRPAVLLSQRPTPRAAHQGTGPGPFEVEELGGKLPGRASSGRNRACVSRRLEGARAVHRRGPHRPHSQG